MLNDAVADCSVIEALTIIEPKKSFDPGIYLECIVKKLMLPELSILL